MNNNSSAQNSTTWSLSRTVLEFSAEENWVLLGKTGMATGIATGIATHILWELLMMVTRGRCSVRDALGKSDEGMVPKHKKK